MKGRHNSNETSHQEKARGGKIECCFGTASNETTGEGGGAFN